MLGLLVLISINFILTSCSPLYYSPNAHNVPLLSQKGEASLNLSLSGGDDVTNAVEIQGAYAVAKNIALLGNFYTARGNEPDYGSGKGSLLEVGAGYFKPFSPKFIFEAYAGGGLGGVTNFYNPDKLNYSRLRFTKFFIQPAFGFESRYFDITLSLRTARLNYHAFNFTETARVEDLTNIQNIKNQPTYYLLEPALTLRGGFSNLKIQIQLVKSKNLTYKEFVQEYTNLNLGLYFRIDTKENLRTNLKTIFNWL